MARSKRKVSAHKIRMCASSFALALAILTSSVAYSAAAAGAKEIDSLLFGESPEVPEADPVGECAAGIPDNAERTSPERIEAAFDDLCEYRDAPVFVQGKIYPYLTVAHAGEIYVSLSEFVGAAIPSAVCSESGDAVSVASDALTLEARAYDSYICANGRCLWCEGGVHSDFDKVTAPLSVAAKTVGMTVEFSDGAYYVTGEPVPLECADSHYDSDDLYWLSRIISCESMSESLTGKIAVGNVVLNRVASPEFPDDVEGVVFDTRCGVVQFSPVAGGYIYSEPDAESVVAAKLCLEGTTLSDSIMYFMNPELSDTTWISDNRPYVMTIGHHSFYS